MTTDNPDIHDSPQPTQAGEQMNAEDGIDWLSLISVLWSSRKLIAMVTGIATVGAAIVSFFVLPEYFKSTATLLPETEKGRLAAMGGLSDLARESGCFKHDNPSRFFLLFAF